VHDSSFSRDPMNRQELWSCIIFVLFLFGLFAAEVYHDYQPVKLGALFIVLFWIPLLAIHELGHALTAAAVGWHVGQVVIGMGRMVQEFKVGSAVVELRVLPIQGFVKNVPTNLHWPRLKNALIYFAGPGADLLVAGLVLVLVGPATLFSRSSEYAVIALQSLAIAAAAQGIINLLPTSIRTPQGDIANDGLGIIRSFFLPESHFAQMIGWRYDPRKHEWQEDGLTDARQWHD
jgi:membrane-associated protease RseP (regulator of RpoE activity)